MSGFQLDGSCNLEQSITISKIVAVEIVQNHDLDLWNSSRSNSHILIESKYLTLCLMAVAMLALSIGHHSHRISCKNLHDIDNEL